MLFERAPSRAEAPGGSARRSIIIGNLETVQRAPDAMSLRYVF